MRDIRPATPVRPTNEGVYYAEQDWGLNVGGGGGNASSDVIGPYDEGWLD